MKSGQTFRNTVLSIAIACSANSYAEDIRSLGMGGTGVASANGDTAAIMNPALMSGGPIQAGWSLVGPGINVEASDKFDIADTIDDMSDIFDDLEQTIENQNINEALANKNAFLSSLAEIDSKPVTLGGNTELAITIPVGSANIAIGGRSTIDVTLVTDYVATDAAIIDIAIAQGNPDILDATQSSVTGIGVLINEGYFALSKGFVVAERNFSASITPKYQEINTIYYKTTAGSFDSDDIEADDYITSDTGVNLDLGLAYYITPKVNAGLVIKNLLGGELDTLTPQEISPSFPAGDALTYELKPKATAGLAYNGTLLTLAADLDLTEDSSFSGFDGSQFARIGAELDLWHWAAIRVGYRYDLNDVRENVTTAGLALSPFNKLHFGISASVGGGNTYGAGAEFKLTL